MQPIEHLQSMLEASGFNVSLVPVERREGEGFDLHIYAAPCLFVVPEKDAGRWVERIKARKLGANEIANALLADQYPKGVTAEVWERGGDSDPED